MPRVIVVTDGDQHRRFLDERVGLNLSDAQVERFVCAVAEADAAEQHTHPIGVVSPATRYTDVVG